MIKPLKSHINKLIQFKCKKDSEYTIARVAKVDQKKGVFHFNWGEKPFTVSAHTIESFDIVGQKE